MFGTIADHIYANRRPFMVWAAAFANAGLTVTLGVSSESLNGPLPGADVEEVFFGINLTLAFLSVIPAAFSFYPVHRRRRRLSEAQESRGMRLRKQRIEVEADGDTVSVAIQRRRSARNLWFPFFGEPPRVERVYTRHFNAETDSEAAHAYVSEAREWENAPTLECATPEAIALAKTLTGRSPRRTLKP